MKIKNAKLSFTPHHLYYLLCKFEELGVDIGPMSVRLENLQNDVGPASYVSFFGQAPKNRGRQSDADSLKSVSSMRSVVSSMSSFWSNLSLSSRTAKVEKQMTQYREDVRYLYSCFTKIPALRLSPDHRARLIAGFEEFPFDTAVPLFAFKNLTSLEISDLDFRQFHGWDRLAEQLRTLTVRRANVDDPIDLLLHIILDDMEKRRKRSNKTKQPATPSTPGVPWPNSSPRPRNIELNRTVSAPNSSFNDQLSRSSPVASGEDRRDSRIHEAKAAAQQRDRSTSPIRPPGSRHGSLTKHSRTTPSRNPRRESGSSNSSTHEMTPKHSTTDLLTMGILPPSKWRFLRHLSLAENGLHIITTASLAPVASTLQSLDLSGNLFSDVPDALASLTHLRALNLSNCMIDSLKSLARHPLPAIVTMNLRSNRLLNLSGIEKMISLERVDLRDNRLRDPTELARLTGFPDIRDIYVIKNPFVKTHPNYRISIFNLFRKTPGNVHDVTIDTLGPTYAEKKSLVDRTPEPANVPVIKPPLEDEEEPATTGGVEAADPEAEPQILEDLPPPTQRHGHRRATSDLGPQHVRPKKRAPRRRLVELSTPDSTPRLKTQKSIPDLAEAAPKTPTDSDQPSTPEQTPYHTAPTQQVPRLPLPGRANKVAAFDSPTPAPKIRESSDDDEAPLVSPSDLGHSELYRQKIEALKTDLGPNWLTAHNESRSLEAPSQQQPQQKKKEPKEPQQGRRSFSPSSRTSTIKADVLSSRGIRSGGGRTLG